MITGQVSSITVSFQNSCTKSMVRLYLLLTLTVSNYTSKTRDATIFDLHKYISRFYKHTLFSYFGYP